MIENAVKADRTTVLPPTADGKIDEPVLLCNMYYYFPRRLSLTVQPVYNRFRILAFHRALQEYGYR